MPAMNTAERRFLFDRSEIRMNDAAEDNESPGIIEGYAAVFYRAGEPGTEFELWPGEMVERIDPGAFDEVGENDVRCLSDHESSRILGRSSAGTLELTVDAVGLFYRCELPNTTVGRDLAESLRRGDVNGSSFQFEIVEQEFTEVEGEPTVRTLKKLRTVDVGPVTFPAYESATSGVRDQARRDLDQVVADRRRAELQQQRRAARRRLSRTAAHRSPEG